MNRFLFVTLFSLQITPAMAEGYDECRKTAASVDPEIMKCQDAELTRQNTRLNAAYAKLLRQLKSIPAAEEKLRDSERAWIKFRDAQCGLIPTVFGDGRADRINYTDCLINMTTARAIDLNKWNSSRTVQEP